MGQGDLFTLAHFFIQALTKLLPEDSAFLDFTIFQQ